MNPIKSKETLLQPQYGDLSLVAALLERKEINRTLPEMCY
jgi:hypothetical protein